MRLSRVLLAFAALALPLSGCGSSSPQSAAAPAAVKSADPAKPAGPNVPDAPDRTAPSGLPIAVHNLGDPYPVDILGDGLVTVTLGASQPTASGDPVAPVRLVLKVNIVLDRAGRPVSGGPQNFMFRDAKNTMYRAKTGGAQFGPELVRTDLTTTGQRVEGVIYFDMPEGAMGGGHVQLLAGAMVVAVWRI